MWAEVYVNYPNYALGEMLSTMAGMGRGEEQGSFMSSGLFQTGKWRSTPSSGAAGPKLGEVQACRRVEAGLRLSIRAVSSPLSGRQSDFE